LTDLFFTEEITITFLPDDDKKNYSVFELFLFFSKMRHKKKEKQQEKKLPTKNHVPRACIIDVNIGMVGGQ